MLKKYLLLSLCMLLSISFIGIQEVSAGACVSKCNQHFPWPAQDGHCVGSQPEYDNGATNPIGTCMVGDIETDFGTTFANTDCDSNVNMETCKYSACPTTGYGVSDGATCKVYFGLGTDDATCKGTGLQEYTGTWDGSRNECVVCSGVMGRVWGNSTTLYYTTPTAYLKELCGAVSACDGKLVGEPCGGSNTCDGSGQCVPPTGCNNDNVCDSPIEDTSNCPHDCCNKTCGGGCTDAANCQAFEPDCSGFCADSSCASDTDCASWECNGGTAHECGTATLTSCSSLDGSSCGAGMAWECDGCKPGCTVSFGFGCAIGTTCYDAYDTCDCECEVSCLADGVCMTSCASDPDCTAAAGPSTGYQCAGGSFAYDVASGGLTDCNTICTASAPFPGDCTPSGCTAATGTTCSTETAACYCGSSSSSSSSSSLPAITPVCDPTTGEFCNPLAGTVDSLVEGGEKIVSAILGLIGTIALLFFIIAGIMYITAGGEEEKINSAKRMLTGTVIGLGIALISFSLLQVIVDILG